MRRKLLALVAKRAGRSSGNNGSMQRAVQGTQRSQTEIDMKDRARALGVQMTDQEIREAVSTMPMDMYGRITQSLYERWLVEKTQPAAERLALLGILELPHGRDVTRRLLAAADFIGGALYSMTGTIVAGEAGMHVVGAVLVGSFSGIGGGTVNNLLMGKTPVFWMENPAWLVLAVTSSLVTFYMWPLLEDQVAKHECEAMHPDAEGRIHPEAFHEWLAQADNSFLHRLKVSLHANFGHFPSPQETFEFLDKEGKGYLSLPDLRALLRQSAMDAPIIYAADTISLTSFAISGAQQGIVRGMHPVICAVAGVTICSGGVFRDLACHRNVAIGIDSYALATGAGATVYVSLRQLMLRGWPLPFEFRLACTVATVAGLRWLAWTKRPNQLLSPMFSD